MKHRKREGLTDEERQEALEWGRNRSQIESIVDDLAKTALARPQEGRRDTHVAEHRKDNDVFTTRARNPEGRWVEVEIRADVLDVTSLARREGTANDVFSPHMPAFVMSGYDLVRPDEKTEVYGYRVVDGQFEPLDPANEEGFSTPLELEDHVTIVLGEPKRFRSVKLAGHEILPATQGH